MEGAAPQEVVVCMRKNRSRDGAAFEAKITQQNQALPEDLGAARRRHSGVLRIISSLTKQFEPSHSAGPYSANTTKILSRGRLSAPPGSREGDAFRVCTQHSTLPAGYLKPKKPGAFFSFSPDLPSGPDLATRLPMRFPIASVSGLRRTAADRRPDHRSRTCGRARIPCSACRCSGTVSRSTSSPCSRTEPRRLATKHIGFVQDFAARADDRPSGTARACSKNSTSARNNRRQRRWRISGRRRIVWCRPRSLPGLAKLVRRDRARDRGTALISSITSQPLMVELIDELQEILAGVLVRRRAAGRDRRDRFDVEG